MCKFRGQVRLLCLALTIFCAYLTQFFFFFIHCSALFTDRRTFNPLMSTGNYSATSNNMKLIHWPLMGGLLDLVQRGGTGRGPSPPRPLLAVPNLTAHPSTASVPITVLMCNSPLLCCFNVPIKGFNLPGEPEEPIVLGDNDTSLSSSSSL